MLHVRCRVWVCPQPPSDLVHDIIVVGRLLRRLNLPVNLFKLPVESLLKPPGPVFDLLLEIPVLLQRIRRPVGIILIFRMTLLRVRHKEIVHQIRSLVDTDRRRARCVLYHRVLHRRQELVSWGKGLVVRVPCLGLDLGVLIRLVCATVGKVAACFVPLLRVDRLLWPLLCFLTLLLLFHQLKLNFPLEFFVLLPFLGLFCGLPPLVFFGLPFEFFLVHFSLHFLPFEFRGVDPIKSFGKGPVNLIGICYGGYSLSEYVHFPACERDDIVECVILANRLLF